MFVGVHERQLDERGRVALPSQFRGDLGDHCYLFLGDDGCVTVRSEESFQTQALELIEQVNDAPSPNRDFIASGCEGLQHLGYWAYDFDEACRRVEAAGYEREFVIPIAGQPQPIIYYRSRSVLGPMLEIVPARWQRVRQAVFDRISTWTGPGSLIRYGAYGEFLAEAKISFD